MEAIAPIQKKFFTTAEAAAYTGFAEITLRKWRVKDAENPSERGPRYTKPNGRIRYSREDLDAFLSQSPRD